ncbi:MAG: T9SS type A sorting domain-containing protein [Crocinitomix sp.]|nr:T9SS type A sorting domain-containing protein [Crocinitomix sp.]
MNCFDYNEIVLAEIARGVYILEVRNGEEVLSKRIVKK